MKTLYNQIKNYVQTNINQIAHTSLWNDQINNLEDEVPFMRPALFVELGAIQWNTASKRQKTGTITITLHLITDCYDTLADDNDALQALDLLDTLASAFDGVRFENCTPLVPNTTTTDSNHGNLIHLLLDYSTEITSCITDKKNYTAVEPDLQVTGFYNMDYQVID